VPHDELADALWGEALPTTWEPALRGVVKKARDFLTDLGFDGSSLLRTANGCSRLDLPHALDVDIERVRRASIGVEASLREGRYDDAMSQAEVIRVPSGEFLPGEDASWIDAERSGLRRLRMRALEIISEAARVRGDFGRSAVAAEDVIAADSLNETAHRLLIEAHEAAGDRGRSLRAYERCREVLNDQLGVDPSAQTQDVYLRVLRADAPSTLAGRPAFPGALHVDGSFIGRADELERLEGELELAREGALRLVVVAGDPGIGKTRVAAEISRRAYDDGSTVLYGRCDEDAIGPYQPFTEALSRIVRGIDDDAVPQALAQLVPGLDAGRSDPDETITADPITLRFRLFEGVARAIAGAVSNEAGCVLVLDDLHWADRPTLLLLEHIARSCAHAPVLVVATYRSGSPSRALVDAFADIRRDHVLTELRLDGLTIGDMEALVLGWNTRLAPSLARALHERTDGNPFFALEILRHLQEGTDEVELHTADLDTSGIPAGVRDVIHRRLSRLSQDVQDVLLMASVVGRHFDLALTERLVRADMDVPLALEEAAAAGLVEEIPDVLGQYRFGHHLVRQVLYDDLSPTRRARLHLRVGESLEDVVSGGPESRASELAHHFAIAAPVGDPVKAVAYLELAAARAMELFAFEDAAAHYERARAFFPDDDDGTRARVLISLAEAHGRSGDLTGACLTLYEAIPSARRAGLLDDLGETLLRATSFLASNWDQEAWDAGHAGLELLPDGDSAVRAVLISRLALATQSFGSPAEATRRTAPLSIEAHEMASRVGDPTALAAGIQARLLCDPSPELLAHRLDLLNELRRLSERTGNDPLLMNAHLWLGMEQLARGALSDARASMTEFDRLGAVVGHPWAEWRTTATLANWSIMHGDFDAAEQLMARELEIGRRTGIPQARPYHSFHLFQLRRDQGRLDEILDASIRFYSKVPGMGIFELMTYVEAGMDEQARAVFARHAADDFGAIARTFPGWWIGICFLSYMCDALRLTDHAQALYDLFAPYEGRHVVGSGLASYWGPADLALGGLAATLGRTDDAERHLVRAFHMCDDVDSPTWRVRTQLRLGELLLEDDRDRARRLLDEAAGTAESIGMRGLAARISELG
jgi:DNA-binding SARP family transcriptional activator